MGAGWGAPQDGLGPLQTKERKYSVLLLLGDVTKGGLAHRTAQYMFICTEMNNPEHYLVVTDYKGCDTGGVGAISFLY